MVVCAPLWNRSLCSQMQRDVLLSLAPALVMGATFRCLNCGGRNSIGTNWPPLGDPAAADSDRLSATGSLVTESPVRHQSYCHD